MFVPFSHRNLAFVPRFFNLHLEHVCSVHFRICQILTLNYENCVTSGLLSAGTPFRAVPLLRHMSEAQAIVHESFVQEIEKIIAMASFIESQAVLEARLKAAGFTDEVKDLFINAGIKCLSQLAFMSSYSPGANDETTLIDAFKTILARAMRRIFNEAYASVTAEMRQNVERVEETTVRKLSQPERHDRYIKQSARLTGVAIKGATEPGDSLVDAFCSMYDDNRLRFLEWEKYVSKGQEMQSEGKKITSFAIDQGSGKLKIENKGPDEKADTSSDILMLQALTRRSLAMDQANVVSFTKMQAWVDKLVKCRTDEPPPG